jgi:hypothetical protein
MDVSHLRACAKQNEDCTLVQHLIWSDGAGAMAAKNHIQRVLLTHQSCGVAPCAAPRYPLGGNSSGDRAEVATAAGCV